MSGDTFWRYVPERRCSPVCEPLYRLIILRQAAQSGRERFPCSFHANQLPALVAGDEEQDCGGGDIRDGHQQERWEEATRPVNGAAENDIPE